MNIIFKGIKTPKHYYIYDRGRNAILEVDAEEYEELENIQNGNLKSIESKVLERYQHYGFLKENTVTKIEHPCTHALKHYLSNHLEKLTLQVTQRCNLRCEYCIYSGNYDTRTHSELDMDFDTAKRAIDFYLNASNELDELTVAFYGGEPLLNIELIRKCVVYVYEKSFGRRVVFSITTNGTLLNENTVSFLEEHKFNVMISLDGSQKEHDTYRKFQNGKGSFKVIQENLRRIKEKHPEFFKKISYNSVLNPENDYQNIKDYFEKDDLLASADVFTNIVESEDLTQDIQFSETFSLINKFDYLKLCLFMLGKLDEEDVSKLVLVKRSFIYERYHQITKKAEIGDTCHPGGPCIPGTRRLFVNVQGYMFPCERVSETSPVMAIGHLDSGFDIKKVNSLLNIGKITEDLCKNCWALFHCNQCAQKADGKDHLSRELKVKHCPISKGQAFMNLKEICILKELGCTFER
ncbi:Cys-rich peptide radical SAM maturase CcpM [Petralouisia muris]|uniref:Cys-rich peptide radical SAM maturase CcpM n=1 Tax=Petralouisia muris TaxID=3032872 RepID=A0AC61RQA0_9FIRM|nr:Cys-rich peptide radical SAM maturase CcpM [Petralouisia muris]TGY91100.1 Cys-rich peptide radical SAM maturase CcpM [Petralouisia muris]